MRTQADLDATREVRRVMVRHWIDLGRLSIRSQNGRIMIYGLLQRIAGLHEPLTTSIVQAMFTEVKRVKGVRSLGVHIENWTDSGGMWRPVEGAGNAGRTAAGMKPPGSQRTAREFTLIERKAQSES